MVSPKILRRRIRSVQSTAKITRAMEMIATAKMKKAQDMAIAGRPYSDKLMQVIADLAAQSAAGGATHPLLVARPIKKIGIVLITSDRGLCGGLNTNLNTGKESGKVRLPFLYANAALPKATRKRPGKANSTGEGGHRDDRRGKSGCVHKRET